MIESSKNQVYSHSFLAYLLIIFQRLQDEDKDQQEKNKVKINLGKKELKKEKENMFKESLLRMLQLSLTFLN